MSETNPYIGRTIGKYKIVELIGRGGMATVFKAYQEGLDRYVALKLMHNFLVHEADFLERFKREARAMGALKHPHIASVYDFDAIDDTYYLVMELIRGGSLKDELDELARPKKPMPLSRAVQIILELLDALIYAHGYGMLHRDIKPGNILLRQDGSAVLTDFGIAKILGTTSHTVTGSMVGTPAYMSPEQAWGRTGNERCDLYSVGILFFQLVTGRLPFEAETPLMVALKHVNEPLPLPALFNPDLPLAIQAIILKSTAKDPKDRYQSGYEFAQALRLAIESSDINLAALLPAHLLRDQATPPPQKTLASPTKINEKFALPRLPIIGLGMDKTELFTPAPAPPPPSSIPSQPTRFWWGIALVLGMVLISSGLFWALGGSFTTPTPTLAAVLGQTSTPSHTNSPQSSPSPLPWTPTPKPISTKTVVEWEQLTLTPTFLPTASTTFTVTPSQTATAEVLCQHAIELVRFFTYNRPQNNGAAVGAEFPLHLVVQNNGSCPWTANWRLIGVDGDGTEFDALLPEPVQPTQQLTLTLPLVAPEEEGQYAISWQLEDEEQQLLGLPFVVSLFIFVPATPTPELPPTLPPPLPTPSVEFAPIGFNIFPRTCEYIGDNWRCEIEITPFGGIGQPYTINVFDSVPPIRYYGGNQYHFIVARRCSPWIHEIRVQDEVGNVFSRSLALDPLTDPLAPLFPGGSCVTP